MRKTYLIIIIIVTVVLASFTLFQSIIDTHEFISGTEIIIPSGASASDIADTLVRHQIIPGKISFLIAARLRNAGALFQSGRYRFPSPISVDRIIDCLVDGSYRIRRQITIPEGLTCKQIASLLQRELRIDSSEFMTFIRDSSLCRKWNIHSPTLEGFLMPETYMVPEPTTPHKLISMMLAAYRKKNTPQMLHRMRALRKTELEILTLASIVEGETSIPDEKKRIAGVYYNRLERGMLLQADPTIQYIIPDGPRRLYFKDLEISSPYNTYRYKGLPPTPVNNPGIESVNAVLYPEKHSFLYFVADGTGKHTFSSTAAEHQIAVNHYRNSRNAR